MEREGEDEQLAATLILVRHGAHVHLDRVLSGREPDVTLSEAGYAQARRAAARLRERAPVAVETSPVERAYETGRAIADFADVGLHVREQLNEIDFGAWTGRSFAELAGDPAWDRWNQERATSRPPGGESMEEAQTRVVTHLAAVAREREGRTVVLVTHADVIRAAVCHVLELELGAFWRFDVDPASATTLEWHGWGARLVRLNEPLGA